MGEIPRDAVDLGRLALVEASVAELAIAAEDTHARLLRRIGDLEAEVDRQATELRGRVYDLERKLDRDLRDLEQRLS